MIGNHLFKIYSTVSLIVPVWIVAVAVSEHKTTFSTLVDLTSFKLNLLIFFNGVMVLLILFSNFLTWLFFGDIRIIEQKYVMDKSQKKIFQFLLLSIVLRNTFDIYKMLGLAILFFFCVIHWLVNKRSDYLVSRGSRDGVLHFKMMLLQNILIFICFIVSYVFYRQFTLDEEAGEDRMSKVYVVIGFEFIQLFLKGIQHNFKYQLTAIELYYREQWVEKGFVLNISRFIFDSLILVLNAKLFLWIFVRGQFPLYLLGESIDTLIKLYKSVQLFVKSRTLVNQLKRLPDVDLQDEAARVGVDTTCIICLDEMTLAKKLRCGHIFHLSCLRRWIEQNVQCPTCRTQIALDQPEARPPGGAQASEGEQANQGQGPRQSRDVRLLLRQQGLLQRRRQQQARVDRARQPSASASAGPLQQQERPAAESREARAERAELAQRRRREAATPQDPAEESKESKSSDRGRKGRDSPATENQPKKDDKSAEVKDIFKVSEFDVLREMGDREPAAVFEMPGQLAEADINQPTNDETRQEERKDPQQSHEQSIQPKQEQKQRSQTLAAKRRSKKKTNQAVGLELDDLVQQCVEDRAKRTRNDQSKNALEDDESEDSDSDFVPVRESATHKASRYRTSASRSRRQGQERMEQLDSMISEMQALLSQQTASSGSVAYGLPTIALTRRTLDVQIKAKQIEMINDKLIRIMRRPQDYLDLDGGEASDLE